MKGMMAMDIQLRIAQGPCGMPTLPLLPHPPRLVAGH